MSRSTDTPRVSTNNTTRRAQSRCSLDVERKAKAATGPPEALYPLLDYGAAACGVPPDTGAPDAEWTTASPIMSPRTRQICRVVPCRCSALLEDKPLAK